MTLAAARKPGGSCVGVRPRPLARASKKNDTGMMGRTDVHVKRAKGIATGDLARDEKIRLVVFGGTGSGAGRPGCESVEGNLGCFIDTNSIDIEGLDGQTGKDFDSGHDVWTPFTKTVLNGGEFGQLALPIGVDTKGLHVTELIEIGKQATVRGLNLEHGT